jgi:uncharacterized protein YodC (DUF2158 family)
MDSPSIDVFETGDVVQLKSGGPIMTVDAIEKYGVWACWFAYGKRHRNRFAALSLQRAEPGPARQFRTRPTAPTLP